MTTSPTIPAHDVIVVGAGFAGMYTVIHAARRGLRVLGFEAGSGVGGTWYWNRYPGARCDVESIDYSYSFDPELEREWRWSERYATQPEILRYLEHVADRFDVRPQFRFNTRVTSAHWNEPNQYWVVGTDDGEVTTARWVVMASGPLSTPILPDVPGRDSFTGEVYQTSAWPHEAVDFTDKRVAVIGTGSSGVQTVPEIAAQTAELVVYQRTANYSIPAFNYPLDDAEWAAQQAGLAQRRTTSWNGPAGSPWSSHPEPFESLDDAARDAVFEEAWQLGGVLFAKAFQRQTIDTEINDAARVFFERKLAERVSDPAARAVLTPSGHALGTKRICTDSGYYEAFNLPHVQVVSLRDDPILEITPTGITTASGTREFDAIVYATGFDAMTGALTSIDIRGRDDRRLSDEWADGPVTLLGVGLPGFPNLLALNGPGTPSVFANMALTSEQQGGFALDLIEHCAEAGFSSAEARADAAEAWTAHTQEVAHATLFGAADSWYTGANIAGKSRSFLPYAGGFAVYIEHANTAVAADYAGFVFSER